MRRWPLFFLAGVLSLAACGGGKDKLPPGVQPLEIVTTSPLPDAVVNRDYVAIVAISGGTQPYLFRVTQGQFPAGLTLNSSIGVITGQATTTGSSTFTVEVSDSTLPVQRVSREFTLNVREELVVTTDTLPDATVAVNYSAQLDKTGGTGNVTWSLTGQLPAGLTLDSSTGIISGLPINEETRGFTVQVTDSGSPAQSAFQSLSITVLPGTPGVIARVSVDSLGVEADGASSEPAVSADGRQVAFSSDATNLVANDSNSASDIFLFDLITASTTRLSVSTAGGQANNASRRVALTGTVTAAVFESDATNLAGADTNGATDIYIRLISANQTGRVSLRSDGTEASGASLRPAISDAARFVAFVSDAATLVSGDANGVRDLFLRDRAGAATTTRISVGPGGVEATQPSDAPSISAGGNLVAFESAATELTAPATNGTRHIFLHDEGVNSVASVALNLPEQRADIFGPDSVGNSALTMTPAEHVGRRVRVALALPQRTATLFTSNSIGSSALTMTVDEHVGRRVQILSGIGAGQERRITANTADTLFVDPVWSPVPDSTSVFRIVSGPGEVQERIITSNSVDTLVVATPWDTTPDNNSVFWVVSEGDGDSQAAAFSADGNFIAFASDATNLIGLDAGALGYDTNAASDIFVHERQTGQTWRVSQVLFLANQTADISSATTIGNSLLTMTPDEHLGRLVEIADGLGAGQVRRVTANDATTLTVDLAWMVVPDATSVFRVVGEANGASFTPSISGDGRFVAFQSLATNLDPSAPDSNGFADIFVYDRQTGQTTRVSVRPDGTEADGESRRPKLGRNGRFCAFESDATNLLTLPLADTNGVPDIFLAFTGVPVP